MKTKQLLRNILPVLIMTALCFLRPSGLSILFAIPYLFIERAITKTPFQEIGFQFKALPKDLKSNWWLVLLPTLSGIVAVVLSKFLVPDFYLHVIERTKPMLAFDQMIILIPQLLVLAFGEELAFRAFMQGKLRACIHPVLAVGITSFIFACAHYSAGSIAVVVYDIFFIFVDSVIYGIVFNRTKNVYVNTISHFVANLVGVLIILFLPL